MTLDRTMNRLIYLAALLLVLTGCSGNEDTRPGLLGEPTVVVARAGDVTVTADEFRLAWEFGYGHLRRAEDPVRTYLAYMVAEKLLAREARHRHLDTLALVRHNVESLREDLLVERVFTERVMDRVEVSDSEIVQEMARNAVRFQFRFVPAPDSAGAARVREVYVREGYDAAAEVSVGSDRAPLLSAEWTSPLTSAADLDPELVARIQDLEIGVPSAPTRYGKVWYVFEVMDVRRRGIAPSEDTAARRSTRKVLFNRKALEGATRFVSESMEPMQVTTKRVGFEALESVLWSWYRAETPTRPLLWLAAHRAPRPGLADSLAAIHDLELVRHGTDTWTVRAFLERFTPDRYPLRARNRTAFRGRLADVIALVVRDHYFMELAAEEGWDDHPVDAEILSRWEDKYLFLALRDTQPDFDHLALMADSLLRHEELDIDWSVADTLTGPASTVNPFMTVHLMKGSSSRMPFPIVDPNWTPTHLPNGF